MNTVQNYATASSDATPEEKLGQNVLAEQIQHLQNILLLASQLDPNHYSLHRQVENLGIEIRTLIHGLDPLILEAISHPSLHA